MRRLLNLSTTTATLLALQMLLVVTGGLVRVTGSGLGCPTWPKCTAESFTPNKSVSHFHTYIEFGNRMLTFALFAAAIAVLIAVSNAKRNDLKLLAWLQLGGIFGQGILGGITVLTKLNPIPVAGHLLLSMILIAGATNLNYKVNKYRTLQDQPIAKILATFAFLTLVAGTIVTGSGPHAGDWQAPRFDIAIALAAKFHGALVTITLLIAFYIALKMPRKEANWLIVVMFGQALIGLLQWWLGLPQALVGLHLLGASLFWFTAWRTRISFKYEITKG